ncbi:hypothetical protein GCD22_01385 [Acidithiobacillus thiooxidans ATCC 19377]|uniref:Uncharacterized protein n=1 Tax=Acidithiobacillus thiooxidans ATCC 19377 TaxID=637390 RepID=A0A5P9XQ73_ACITH|nr:hypothetical protein GCD22_01385 [Acidithiobacillus thiooxidans ATCC 19377]
MDPVIKQVPENKNSLPFFSPGFAKLLKKPGQGRLRGLRCRSEMNQIGPSSKSTSR